MEMRISRAVVLWAVNTAKGNIQERNGNIRWKFDRKLDEILSGQSIGVNRPFLPLLLINGGISPVQRQRKREKTQTAKSERKFRRLKSIAQISIHP
jgi:hypothetical protein